LTLALSRDAGQRLLPYGQPGARLGHGLTTDGGKLVDGSRTIWGERAWEMRDAAHFYECTAMTPGRSRWCWP
jgi:hypothetical protein